MTRNLHRGAAFVAGAELNALRQRQLAREIDGVGLSTHVALPAIASALASAARLLFAAERAADFGATRSRVHIGDTAVASHCADKFFCLSHIVSKNGGGQTLRNSILDRDRFVEIAIRHQIEQRPKRFMTNNFELR